MSRLFKTALIGTIVTAICCFTPILVWVFTALGIGGLIVYLDIVLLPLLGVFIALLLWAFVKSNGLKN